MKPAVCQNRLQCPALLPLPSIPSVSADKTVTPSIPSIALAKDKENCEFLPPIHDFLEVLFPPHHLEKYDYWFNDYLGWKSLELLSYKVEPMTLGPLRIGKKAQESSCREFFYIFVAPSKSILLELRQYAF